MPLRRLRHLLLLLFTVFLMLPVLAVLASWLPWGEQGAQTAQILGEMARTVLPDYALTTLVLCLLVALGVVTVGL
jgi:iron(III) transport system permease protein